MKVQIEFDLTIRSSRVALMTMITAIDKLDTEPARRRESSDQATTATVGDSDASTLVVQTGEVVASGGESSTPLSNGSGDPAKEAEPEHLRGRGDGSGDEPAPQPRRRGRRAAPAPEEPPEPPPPPPVEGKALEEDVSGPDDETVSEHSILSPDFRLETIGKDGFGRSKLTGEKYELSVTEARETALKNLHAVYDTGDPKIRKEIAEYQRELGLRAFRDCPDDQAYAMYRRSIELMHAVGKSA